MNIAFYKGRKRLDNTPPPELMPRLVRITSAGTQPVPTGFADIEPDLPTLEWPQ